MLVSRRRFTRPRGWNSCTCPAENQSSCSSCEPHIHRCKDSLGFEGYDPVWMLAFPQEHFTVAGNFLPVKLVSAPCQSCCPVRRGTGSAELGAGRGNTDVRCPVLCLSTPPCPLPPSLPRALMDSCATRAKHNTVVCRPCDASSPSQHPASCSPPLCLRYPLPRPEPIRQQSPMSIMAGGI